VALAVSAFIQAVLADDIGTHLTRTYGLFREQPLNASDAVANGWSSFGNSECDPVLGYTYAQNTDGSGPSRGSPTILSYTANGQLNGFGVRVWSSSLSTQLQSAGYWHDTGLGDNSFDMMLTTRGTDPNVVCGSEIASELIGNQLNIWGNVQSIALNMTAAEAGGWVMGNCIPKMGMHHAYDLNAPGSQTWNYQSLVPVQPMYDGITQNLNAVLINVPAMQLTEPIGELEGPFINMLFCKNWCANTGCDWSGVTVWTTLHFHLVPIDSISCDGAPCSL